MNRCVFSEDVFLVRDMNSFGRYGEWNCPLSLALSLSLVCFCSISENLHLRPHLQMAGMGVNFVLTFVSALVLLATLLLVCILTCTYLKT